MTIRTSKVRIDMEPLPAPRPRFSKWGSAYFPASYVAFKKELVAALPKVTGPALEGELEVEIEFVCKPIKKSKFTTPAGDLDNHAKGLLDVLTQSGWYGDDRQITRLILSKRFPRDDEQPNFTFQIKELT